MTISDPNSQGPPSEENIDCESQQVSNSKMHLIYQKLIIKHSRLKKLSLWGCSGLDVSFFFPKMITKHIEHYLEAVSVFKY